MTMMSVQEMWFDAISSGRWSAISPCTWTRRPSALTISQCHKRGTCRRLRQPGLQHEHLQGRQDQRRCDDQSKASQHPDRTDHVAPNAPSSAELRLAKIAAHDKRGGLPRRRRSGSSPGACRPRGSRAGGRARSPACWSRRLRGTAPRRAAHAARAARHPSAASRGPARRCARATATVRISASPAASRASTKPTGPALPLPVSKAAKPNTVSWASSCGELVVGPGPDEILAVQRRKRRAVAARQRLDRIVARTRATGRATASAALRGRTRCLPAASRPARADRAASASRRHVLGQRRSGIDTDIGGGRVEPESGTRCGRPRRPWPPRSRQARGAVFPGQSAASCTLTTAGATGSCRIRRKSAA